MESKELIRNGNISIGIEFGSTRIKAVLIAPSGAILASGGFNWENHFDNGIWTYPQQEIWHGLQHAYADLAQSVKDQYGETIHKAQAIGISGMMHGYIPFERQGNQLAEFRTWRNNITSQAAEELTDLFQFNIPQRWSIAHLYQSILNQEKHLSELDFFTTLAGYVHWQLTDEKVLGVGEASGMFPIDTHSNDYDQIMLDKFEQHIADKQYVWKLREILPKVLVAGEQAGKLTVKGAALLDPTGNLQAGIPFCPPEGDAGTGMVATNSIKPTTGNISAGTSAFAMIVLEKALSQVYPQLDLVTTPAGKLVAMAHANNCTSDINAWIGLLNETLHTFGMQINTDEVYQTLFNKALEGDADCGGLLAYGFYSGEHGVGLNAGCPVFTHAANTNFNLANFIRVHLYSAFGAMKLGMDILLEKERVKISQILAHGGIFKTQGVAQGILSAALNVPIAVMQTASEGGAWGMALLANYLHYAKQGLSLEQYLDQIVFKHQSIQVVEPQPEIHQGYQTFIRHYQRGLGIVQAAVNANSF